MNINKSNVDKISFIPNTSTPYQIYWDTQLKGFGIRVGRKRKTYFVQRKVNGKNRIISIGRHGEPFLPGGESALEKTRNNLTPNMARNEATKIIGSINSGIDPRAVENEAKQKAEVERQNAKTLGEYLEEFLESRKAYENPTNPTVNMGKQKASTQKSYRFYFNKYYADWLGTPLREIDVRMVDQRKNEMPQGVVNSALAYLSSVFNFAIKRQPYNENAIINPVSRVDKLPKITRERLIEPSELPVFFKAFEAFSKESRVSMQITAKHFLLCLLFLGFRKNELARLRWYRPECEEKWLDYVDIKKGWIKLFDTKNRKGYLVPMSDVVLEIMRKRHELRKQGNPYVFTGKNPRAHYVEPKKQITRICEIMTGIFRKNDPEHKEIVFSCHDLRRSYGTIINSVPDIAHLSSQLMRHSSSLNLGISRTTFNYQVRLAELLKSPQQKIADKILEFAKLDKKFFLDSLQVEKAN